MPEASSPPPSASTRTRNGTPVAAATAIVVMCLLLAACGGGSHKTTTTAPKRLAKVQVLQQASLAYGAFRRFIFTPAHAGDFSDPASPAITTGSAAALFASTQLNVAAHHALDDKQLRTLFAPLTLTADKIKTLAHVLSQPSSLARINDIEGILARISGAARELGQSVVAATPQKIAAAGGPHS